MQSHRKTKTLQKYLTDKNNTVGALISHIEYIQHLQTQLHVYLGSPLNNHCIIANYNNSILSIHADSPSWAAKLRYQTLDILGFMQQQCHLTKLKTIRIKVMPTVFNSIKSTKRHLKLSGKSSVIISEVAKTMPNKALRNSLLKIAKHGR